MVSVLFDTNILVDHFAGVKEATAELERYEDAAITSITWLEVLSGAEPHQLQDMRDYMSHFTVYDLDDVIADEAAAIRRSWRRSAWLGAPRSLSDLGSPAAKMPGRSIFRRFLGQ